MATCASRGSGVVWCVSQWWGLVLRWFVRFVCLSRVCGSPGGAGGGWVGFAGGGGLFRVGRGERSSAPAPGWAAGAAAVESAADSVDSRMRW